MKRDVKQQPVCWGILARSAARALLQLQAKAMHAALPTLHVSRVCSRRNLGLCKAGSFNVAASRLQSCSPDWTMRAGLVLVLVRTGSISADYTLDVLYADGVEGPARVAMLLRQTPVAGRAFCSYLAGTACSTASKAGEPLLCHICLQVNTLTGKSPLNDLADRMRDFRYSSHGIDSSVCPVRAACRYSRN